MHIGLMMECDYREGRTQDEAFDEAFSTAEAAEEWGIGGVWLAERHFAPPWGAGAIPSVVASPLIFATAIASRTSSLRLGTAVLVLPLGHPVRMAEEVATLDNICRGRLELGVGRSGFPRAYEGYDIPYAESRERFAEYLEVMRQAWSQERFSYQGKYYSFENVCLIPKPYQKPHPPLRYAVTTRETFATMGQAGMPIFVGLGGASVADLAEAIPEYRAAWREAGHPGEGDVMLRVSIYLAEDMDRALSEPRDSAMRYYDRIRRMYRDTAGSFGGEARAQRAQQLAGVSYEDVLQDRLVFGTPQVVAERLRHLIDQLGLTGVIMESNVGGQIPPDLMFNSVRLFGQEVGPALQ